MNRLVMLSLLTAIFCLFPSGCGGDPKGDPSAGGEGEGAERVGAVEEILKKHAEELPSEIESAHFVEEQIGGGVLGPSDFTSFCAFSVPETDLVKWTILLGALEPSNEPPTHAAPEAKVDWWVSEKQFSHLKFYSGKKLTGRNNGWAGVDYETGEIFVFSYTM